MCSSRETSASNALVSVAFVSVVIPIFPRCSSARRAETRSGLSFNHFWRLWQLGCCQRDDNIVMGCEGDKGEKLGAGGETANLLPRGEDWQRRRRASARRLSPRPTSPPYDRQASAPG